MIEEHEIQAPPVPVVPPPHHSPEREELQATARRFAAEEVLPVANELDPVKGEIPRSLLERMAGHGWFGITVDREHGGLGPGAFEYCMVAEELARAWTSVGSIIARAQGAGTDVADPQRRARLLRRSAAGEWIGAIALSEPDAGSDLAGVATRTVRAGGPPATCRAGGDDHRRVVLPVVPRPHGPARPRPVTVRPGRGYGPIRTCSRSTISAAVTAGENR